MTAPNRPDEPANQGEGNVTADRHYRDATEKFVRSGQVDEAAADAAPANDAEAREMEEAEREGRSHAKP
jgi:hypothetical protein